MKARRAGLLLALVLGSVGVLSASADEREVAVRDPLPFSHSDHAATFSAASIACTDCHPQGLSLPEGMADTVTIPDPRSACHACHLQEVAGAKRAAPRACAACHSDMIDIMPNSHNIGWVTGHGDEARLAGATCSDCHAASRCLDCHEDRGALSRSPHGPAFRGTHGVEAAVDPASCSRCHAPSTCTNCHKTGGLGL